MGWSCKNSRGEHKKKIKVLKKGIDLGGRDGVEEMSQQRRGSESGNKGVGGLGEAPGWEFFLTDG